MSNKDYQNKLTQFFIELMEAGYLPDSLIRWGIKKLLKVRIKELNNEIKKSSYNEYLQSYISTISKSELAVHTRAANHQHYEVPTEFYDYCLGDHKKYSCCYWENDTDTLEDAEARALEVSIERAEIKDGMSILELGCGWGSMSLELAKRFPSSKITVVSNSKTQKKYIDQKAKENNFNNLEVLTLDLGKIENYHFSGSKFDRVISIEMMEHIRNYSTFMKNVSLVMNPNALFFVHIFTHKTTPYFFENEGEDNWMGKYFFTGGQMPSANLVTHFSGDLTLNNQWTWSGKHYEKTSNAWLEKMDLNRQKILTHFQKVYGISEAQIWFQRWRVFYMSCAELFGYDDGNEWFVSHYLFKKR